MPSKSMKAHDRYFLAATSIIIIPGTLWFLVFIWELTR